MFNNQQEYDLQIHKITFRINSKSDLVPEQIPDCCWSNQWRVAQKASLRSVARIRAVHSPCSRLLLRMVAFTQTERIFGQVTGPGEAVLTNKRRLHFASPHPRQRRFGLRK